jgi:hypothetical protein
MAGMLPNKRTRDEIERDMDRLREGHQRSVDSWMKNRFATEGSTKHDYSSRNSDDESKARE